MFYGDRQEIFAGNYEYALDISWDAWLVRKKTVRLINGDAAHHSIPGYV